MTNPHRVIKAIVSAYPDHAKAHRLAYAIGMTTELHDKAKLADDDSTRLENDPELLGYVTDEVMSGYYIPEDMVAVVEELDAIVKEWAEIALIWDDVRKIFPARYPVTIDHLEMNRWDVTIHGDDGKEIYYTYLIVNGQAERQ